MIVKLPPGGCKGGGAASAPFFGVSPSGLSTPPGGGGGVGVRNIAAIFGVVVTHHELRDVLRARASLAWRRLPTLLAARIAACGAGTEGGVGPLEETDAAMTDRALCELEASETEENIADETDSDSVGESGADSFSERPEVEGV